MPRAYLRSQEGQLGIGVHAIHDGRLCWQGSLNVLLHAGIVSGHRRLEAWCQLQAGWSISLRHDLWLDQYLQVCDAAPAKSSGMNDADMMV